MRKNFRLISSILLLSALTLSACSHKTSIPIAAQNERIIESPTPGEWADEPIVHNVIFVVGDGMGTAQVYSSIVNQKEESQFLRFPFSGFSRTYSNNKYTTDSGAGGSALMTGHKVNNYHIALGTNGTEYSSILTFARKAGKATGFVVTSSVLDATPASTYGHVPDRKMKDTLSLQMSLCGFDVMIGGDKESFETKNRHDGNSPLDTLIARGYTMAYSVKEMCEAQNTPLCALVTANNPGRAYEREDMLTLGTTKALDLLSKAPKGFVLMVEGSQIDWACHNNDSTQLREEMADFEKTLKIILDFAQKDGHTLVVVTADHETGGLALTGGDIEDGENTMKFITQGHSGCMVPVFAFGPGAEQFTGIMQNTDLFYKFFSLLGL